jgi:hypothetical protein
LKTLTQQHFLVEKTDGTRVVACCGPAVMRMADVRAYLPIGEPRPKRCCHQVETGPGRIWELQMGPVRAWLARRAGRQTQL